MVSTRVEGRKRLEMRETTPVCWSTSGVRITGAVLKIYRGLTKAFVT
jgi:hypothetical protein